MQPWRGVGDLQDLKSAVNFLPIYATLKRINYLDIDVIKVTVIGSAIFLA
jgi:hypothetical protein